MISIDKAIQLYNNSMNTLQEKIKKTHASTIKKCREIFEGKTVVLCATGPTSSIFTKIDEPCVIYVGVNSSIYNKNLPIEYYFAYDYSSSIDAVDYLINNLKGKFYGINLDWIPAIIPEKYRNNANLFYGIGKENFIEKMAAQNSNIEKSPIITFASIVLQASILLLSSGARKLYLVGCDCAEGRIITDTQSHSNSSKNHYESLILGWKAISQFIIKNNIKCDIISVNPRGLRGIFIDKYQNRYAVDAIEYYEDKQFDIAREYAKKACEKEPYNEGCLNLYTKCLRMSHDQTLLPFINKRIKEDNNWLQGYVELANYYKDNDNIEMSMYFLQKGNKIAHKDCTRENIDLKLHLALLLYQQQKFEELEHLFDEISMPCFKRCFSDFLYRTTHFSKNTEGIRKIIQDCCNYNPDSLHIELDLAMRYREAHMYDEAENIMKNRLKHDPENAAVYRFLYFIIRDRISPYSAYQYAEKMFQIAPWWHYSWQYYIESLVRIGRSNDALKFYLALKNNIYNIQIEGYLIKIYEGLHDYSTAIKVGKKAKDEIYILRNLERLQIIFDYCRILRKEAHYDESKEILFSYLERFPDNINILRNISLHYIDTGNVLMAFKYSKRAFELEPENNSIFLDYIHLLQKMGANDKALFLLEERSRAYKECSIFYYEIALMYEKKTDIDTAIKYIDIAISYDNHNYKFLSKSLDLRQKKSGDLRCSLYCSRYIRNNPDIGFLYIRMSTYLHNLKNEEFFDYAYDGYMATPEDIWCFVGLFKAFIWNNMHDKAIKFAKCYLKIHPNRGLCYRSLAEYYEKIDPWESDKFYSLACSTEIHNVSLIIEKYISFLNRHKDLNQIRKIYETYLSSNPHWRKGWKILLDSTKNPEEKFRIMQNCCDKNPSWAEMNFNIAVELEKQSDQQTLTNIEDLV